MSTWSQLRLDELGQIVTGATPRSSDVDSWGDEIDFVTPSDQVAGTREARPSRRLSATGVLRLPGRLVPAGSTALTCIGSTIGKVSRHRADSVTNQQINTIVARDGVADPSFLYYLISGWSPALKLAASGSATPIVNKSVLSQYLFEVPEMQIQKALGEVFDALDDKIAANDRVCLSASALAKSEYERALDLSSRSARIGDVADFHNRRRVPLSSSEREERTGSVPYYGAAGRLGWIDEALFEGQFVLVGEDGSVVRDDGGPVVQYIWGPAWVNNHAHVLTGRSVSTELLRLAIERESVTHIVTGAAQPKISMGNLKTQSVTLPTETAELEAVVQGLVALTRALTDECDRLAATRDELLPLLMAGKLRVKDAEKAAEDVL